MFATRPTHPILFDIVILIVLVEITYYEVPRYAIVCSLMPHPPPYVQILASSTPRSQALISLASYERPYHLCVI